MRPEEDDPHSEDNPEFRPRLSMNSTDDDPYPEEHPDQYGQIGTGTALGIVAAFVALLAWCMQSGVDIGGIGKLLGKIALAALTLLALAALAMTLWKAMQGRGDKDSILLIKTLGCITSFLALFAWCVYTGVDSGKVMGDALMAAMGVILLFTLAMFALLLIALLFSSAAGCMAPAFLAVGGLVLYVSVGMIVQMSPQDPLGVLFFVPAVGMVLWIFADCIRR